MLHLIMSHSTYCSRASASLIDCFSQHIHQNETVGWREEKSAPRQQFDTIMQIAKRKSDSNCEQHGKLHCQAVVNRNVSFVGSVFSRDGLCLCV